MDMGSGLGRVTKHPDYYISDGSVSFLIGITLFRVHRSFFERESEFFRDLFARAAEEDPKLGTDDLPFRLNVKPEEFIQFLLIWYDREYSYQQQTKENWDTILRLATLWEFPKIKELAIREIDNLGLSPAERIAIYNKHGIDDDRLLNSYVELCKSPTVPTEEEGHLMEMETLINILQAREDAQRKASKLRQESPTSAGLEDETLREIVSRFFETGLNPRSNGTSTGSGVQAPTGRRPQGTSANKTITLQDPQVPDKSSRTSSRMDSFRMGKEGKESQEKEQGNQAENSMRGEPEQPQDEGEGRRKLTKGMQDEEGEEKETMERVKPSKEEKARQDKEGEEREKEKARRAREKEERAREKEAGEKLKKAEEQKLPETPNRNARSK